MRLQVINHLHLNVSDMARAEVFYQKVLGLEKSDQDSDGTVHFNCGSFDIGLIPGEAPQHANFHFGYRTGSRQEVRDWRVHLERSHVRIDTFVDDGSNTALSFRDPEGYRIDIYFE